MAKRATGATRKKNWKPVVLRELRKGCTLAEAAAAAKVDRTTVWRHKQDDAEFAAAFAQAESEGTDVMEAEATRRAIDGEDEPVIYQGRLMLVGVDKDGNPCDPDRPEAVKRVPLTVKRRSDTLLIFLLKGRRPEKFRDVVRQEVTGADGAPVKHEHKHVVDYAAIESELRSLSGAPVARGVAADN